MKAQTDGAPRHAPYRSTSSEHPILTTGLIAIVMALGLYALTPMLSSSPSYDVVGAFVVTPLLIALTIPLLRRQSEREGDRKLMTLLVLALVLKLVGAIFRYVLVLDVYEGVNDATFYDFVGTDLATQFRAGNFAVPAGGASGSDFIELLTGIVYTFIGPSIIGGFIFFSWLGFLGLFFFYRAFTLAVPEGRRRTYARFIFFLPSFLFWPSSIGKESWMMFTLGIAAYGAANLFTGKTLRGFGIAGLGLWLAALPRPHISAVIGVAIAGAFVLRRPPEHRRVGAVMKLATIVVVAGAAVFFVGQASTFLKDANIDTSQGFTDALEEAADRSSKGGSEFSAPIVTSPAKIPEVVVTVLFRPTVIEAHSPTALIASMESTFLMIYALVRLPWAFGALKLGRRRPYLMFSILVTGLLIGAFSAIGNLGILARERVQIIPFLLVVLCVPSQSWRERQEQREARASAAPERAPVPAGTGW